MYSDARASGVAKRKEKYEFSLHDIAESGKRRGKNMIAIFKVFPSGGKWNNMNFPFRAFLSDDASGVGTIVEPTVYLYHSFHRATLRAVRC